MLGAALACYSVGAWAGGRTALIGALGVGGLVGLTILRASGEVAEPRAIAGPVFVLFGGWLVGLAMRTIRVSRDDERITGGLDWERGIATPDSAGRDDTVRELLAVIEAAGMEALEETQRLSGLLLAPDGTPLPEPQPGLADVDFLTEQVIEAGLPVSMRVQGRPLPLTPNLDAVAYRVVHEALMATLKTTTEARSSVVIRYEPDELQIEVVDDGVTDGDDAEQETAGLMAVRAEVAALGGTLDAAPGEDGGYWVLARLPYEPDWS